MTNFSVTKPPQGTLWIGRALTGFAILFLLMDAGMKIAGLSQVTETAAQMGWPDGVGFWRALGGLLLVCTVLYAWPRTAVLGAVLLTGYLGGAIATHVRIGDGLFPIVFGLAVALMVWGGLWLRSPALRALFPIVSTKD
jgi:hypothetical protein